MDSLYAYSGQRIGISLTCLARAILWQLLPSLSEPGGVTFVSDGIKLNGGDDTLFFTPEPESLWLFASGLPGLLWFRRNRGQAGH